MDRYKIAGLIGRADSRLDGIKEHASDIDNKFLQKNIEALSEIIKELWEEISMRKKNET